MKNGFTLIELLVYVAVLSIILAAVAVLFFWVVSSANKTQAMQETIDSSKLAMDIMTYEIRMADEIYDPTSVFDVHPGQLSLETSTFLPAGESASYIEFYLCGERLCLKRESQDPIAITSGRVLVRDLVFTKLVTGGMASIKIDLGVDYKNPGNRPEFQAIVNTSSTVALRKY